MTSDRRETGIPIGKIGIDKIKAKDPDTELIRDYVLTKEVVLKDSDGKIIGVEKHWQ